MTTRQVKNYGHGVKISFGDADFEEGIRAAVDYRGDVSIETKSGDVLDGFLFNASGGQLDLFPKHSPQKQSVMIDDLKTVVFTGKDEAAGKSWEDWVKKKESTKSASLSSSASL